MQENNVRKNLVALFALLWVAVQLSVMFLSIPGMTIRPFHVGMALVLVFLMKPFSKDNLKLSAVVDSACIVITLVYVGYIILNAERINTRIPFVDDLNSLDVALCVALILLLMEAGRRSLGWSMTIVATVFIAYSLFGAGLPSILRHPPTSWINFLENQTMSSGGIFSSPVGVSCDTVFYFMLLGSFLAATPAGELFVAVSKLATRKSVGGAGKASVLTSGLFGMISGSASANVASVGIMTYPMMQKAGFRPVFSAALLSTAGTGGQLIPPVMGATAFVMSDMIGVPYFQICVAAIIPAFLYVFSLEWEVHLEASKENIAPENTPKSELMGIIKQYFYFLIPIVILVVFIAYGYSLMYAATFSTVVLIILCQLRKQTRLSVKDVLTMCVDGAKSAVVVALPCALSGIVIGEMTYTGLGLRFSALIASFSEGNLLLALALSTIMIIIMGMGMPTTAAYIMSAVLLAPALQKLGIEPLVAHMFIFYFANMSCITPPVAIASYTAAGIAQTDLWETGMEAFRLALVLFLIPFVFVYNPGLLGIGSPVDIAWVTFTCLVGVLGLGAGVIGYWRAPLAKPVRTVAIVAALCLIIPESITDAIGLLVMGLLVFYLLQKNRSKNLKSA